MLLKDDKVLRKYNLTSNKINKYIKTLSLIVYQLLPNTHENMSESQVHEEKLGQNDDLMSYNHCCL